MIKHVEVKGHNALYVDGELLTSWYGNRKPVTETLDLVSRHEIDFSEHGVLHEYGGKRVFEHVDGPKSSWPDTYEEMDDLRDMALYQ